MKVILSLSNQILRVTGLDVPRMPILEGQPAKKLGVQKIHTNSIQVSWQMQCVAINQQWVVIAVEAYSRFTLMLPYRFKPNWEQVYEDFMGLWLAELLTLMTMGRFLKENQEQEIFQQFKAIESVECYKNTDISVNGHVTDAQLWLESYIRERSPGYFDHHHAAELFDHLNQIPRKSTQENGKKVSFIPHQRFLDECLFRFAQGLCDQPIMGCKPGDFPNPYRKPVKLTMV